MAENVAALMQLARKHHQGGQLRDAETLYRRVLAIQPRNAEALHFLGYMLFQAGRPESGLEMIERAIAIDPKRADFHCNRGVVLSTMRRHEESIQAYRAALALKPDFAEVYYNLGTALHAKRQTDEAIDAYRQALNLRPNYPDAYNNLGTLLQMKGRLEESAAAYRQALKLQPNFAESAFNLGHVLRNLGQLEDAIASFRQAINIRPNYADPHYFLGNALMSKGDWDEAVAAYRRALALRPDLVEACLSLAAALRNRGEFPEALKFYRQALVLKPSTPEIYYSLAQTLEVNGDMEEAIEAYQQALKLRPEYVEAQNNLGNVMKDTGRVEQALYWYDRAVTQRPAADVSHSNRLYVLHLIPEFDPATIFQEHLAWYRRHAAPLSYEIPQHSNPGAAGSDRRLKIGYVSPDFRQHSVGFFLLNLLANHAPAAVEVFCYSDAARPDAATARFQQAAHHWKPVVGVADAQLAQIIIQDQIDILVDLAGHTAGNRLLVFARKPAPIQVSYCGYPDTTGLATMDYRFTDAYADPPGTTEQFHSEQLVRLPRCFLCYAPPADGPEVGPVPAAAGGRITFGSFNSISKLSDATVAMWSAVLSAVPNSRLMIKSQGLAGAPARQQVLERFAARGIAADRLELHGRIASPAGHLELYHQIDIALDTYPYHGTTTSCEAMWMGVPVVTLAGKTHASRVGVSLLSNVGLEQLIAQTPEQYVQIAADLAKDLAALSVLRSALRSRLAASPLLDGSGLAREVEAAYRVMWKQWCESAKKA